MSSSDFREACPLHRLTVEAPEPGLGVLVIDAVGSIVGRCAGDQPRLELELPRGLYTVRGNRSGTFAEAVVRLDATQTVKAPTPAVFSAATIPGAETTHEYYTHAAWDASLTPTAQEQAWNGPIQAGLLLFARAPKSRAYAGENQFAGLSLRVPDGRILSTFDADAKRGEDVGWSAYNARFSRGLLILEDCGERPRQIPVPLLPRWQTQLFVMHHGHLLWEDMRLTLVAEHELASRAHRSPYDQSADDVRTALDMDAGLLALQNDTSSVAPQLIRSFLESKFQNPILGLLGAYLMLLNARRALARPDARAPPDPSLIGVVLNNLHTLMPASADVVALRLLAQDWVELPKLESIERVPLFRCGAETLLQAAASDPALVPEGSLLDAISDNLYGDTVWTTWKPIALPVGARVAALSVPATSDTPVASAAKAMTEVTAVTTSTEPSWVELAVVDAIAAAERRSGGFVVDELVQRIGVSPHAVRAAMNTLMARAAAQQLPAQMDKRDMLLLGGEVARSLARKLGAHFDDRQRLQFAIGTSDHVQPTEPTIQQVYAGIKRVLGELADPDSGKVSADTVLAKIMKPDDAQRKQHVRKRLQSAFDYADLSLSVKDLDKASTVRDLAKLIKDRVRR